MLCLDPGDPIWYASVQQLQFNTIKQNLGPSLNGRALPYPYSLQHCVCKQLHYTERCVVQNHFQVQLTAVVLL